MMRGSSAEKMLSPEKLVECVRRHMPDADGDIDLTPTSTGRFDEQFFVAAGNCQLVLRIAPASDAGLLFYERKMMHQEPELHRLLLERTTVPAPKIIAFDPSHDIIDRDFILMERLPGRSLSKMRQFDPSHILKQVGDCLAQVHAITADQYGYLGQHHPMTPQNNWADAFRLMWGLLLDDVASTGHYNSYEVSLMSAMLERHISNFERDVHASLLHMDVWGQNILVHEGELSGLINWERALWGDPEIEFAVLDFCGISESAFWDGYGHKRDASPGERIRLIFYLLYEVQKHIVIDHFRKGDCESALFYKKYAMQLIQELP